MLHIQQQKRLVVGMVLGASSARDMLNIKLSKKFAICAITDWQLGVISTSREI
ncbi:hypothetical protein IQ259_02650 [Fortiea sp. LEGE XX443]|nr:hypothetical protein [Fortiea sp. LEGE XX443]